MYDKDLLHKALSMLCKNTATGSTLPEEQKQPDKGFDATVELTKSATTQKFAVLTKQRPSVPELSLQINSVSENQVALNDIKMLLVADYINPKSAQFLKESNYNFIDSVGNAYLEFGSIFIYITGNKEPKPFFKIIIGSFDKYTSLKLIFTLLCHPGDILNRSYRDLSKISGISLGSVGSIVNDLTMSGYFSSGENGKRKWLDKQRLMERWVVAYPERLRPKLVLGYYQSLQKNWQKGVQIKSFGALWGGEVAADHLTRYLKPELSTIYTEEPLGKLVLMNGLNEVPDWDSRNVNVEVLKKFWHFEPPERPDLVPALLIYADLMASGDSRNLEVARIIYKDYLNVSE